MKFGRAQRPWKTTRSILTSLALILLFAGSAHAQFAGRKFVIDPGHGGTDPGAVGIDGGAYPNEEDFVLDVALRLRTLLENAGATVVMTRTTDTTVSLTARRDLTNAEDPDAFLSIHCNSFTDSVAHGTETFWWTSGNASDQALATNVQSRMVNAFALTNRGVKQAAFTVLTSNPPASLAEMMFISNQVEFDLMNTIATRVAAADAFYRAFADFLGINLNAPVIITQPVTQTVNPGVNAQFTVAATGAGLTYQWRKNGVNLSNVGGVSGVTTATLTVGGAQLASAGFYTVQVTSSGAPVLSNPAQLVIATTPFPAGSGAGLRGTYYDNADFTALRRARVDATVNFDWGAGAPSSTMQADTFSARWTGQIEPRYSQTYTFHTRTDDGVRLWVNGVLLVDKFIAQGVTEWGANIALVAGTKYEVRLDYFEGTGNAVAELRWSSPSQVKEIIPATQLSRPPPVLTSQPDVMTLQGGAPLVVNMVPAGFDPLLSSQPWADFENETDGATDLVLFRKPHFSGTTSAFTDAAKTRETTVVAAFPTGNASTRALHAKWSWAAGAVNPWLRLSTSGAATLPNPIVDFRKSLRFDVWTEHTLKFGLGLRETNSTGAIGSDGGGVGTIEFVGVPSVVGGAPVPERTVASDAWTTLQFDLASESVSTFNGNGVLESTTGLGVLEHLAIAPGSASVDHDVYLDNFVVVENNTLTYSLIAPPPGASIDPRSGAITWLPSVAQAGAAYTLTVQVSDAGSPPLSSTKSFSVVVIPQPEIVSVASDATTFTFSWKAAPGARYDIESSLNPGGPWTVLGGVTATGSTASTSVLMSGTAQFYRARLK